VILETQSRRKFLGALAAAPFALARPTHSCIIIGAGLSGLAAGSMLRRGGWEVTILEARNRIGGRVLSYSFPDAPELVCELGAEWVGASHERMQALCQTLQLKLQPHTFAAGLLQDSTVARPGEWHFSQKAERAFDSFKQEYKQYSKEDKIRLDSFDWWTWLYKLGYTDDDLRLRDLIDSTDFGESIRLISAYAAAGEFFESSAENEMDFKIEGGNSRLLSSLAADIGTEAIRTNAAVREVRQKAGKVTVTTQTGTFTADACICTAAASVLDNIRFDPPLPLGQSSAAASLQYGRIIKNSVLFEERFWKNENFSLVSDATSHYYFHSTQKQHGPHGILCSYAVGDKADVLAAREDSRRMETIARDLSPFSPQAPATAKRIASYAWQRDSFTRGAYALYRPGQWFTLRPILRKPHGKVLFAGEHLADWQGFMEGAVVTGETAARTLLK
jgi:monoamine oxidase